jgi:thiosulfate/3-mercaptopyruvate sulfurtransferase
MYSTLIDVGALKALMSKHDVALVDCRFSLLDLEKGRRDYLAGHIPGAVYADLDRDLSGPATTDHGRHPLPPVERLEALFGNLGIAPATQVVAYDDAGGMVAARLWWMLRYLSHRSVAVLDGGWRAWLRSRGLVRNGAEERPSALYRGRVRADRLVCVDEAAGLATLVDAREPARYRGETESIDPRAGHIPAAANHFYQDNLDADGCFLAAAGLKRAFQTNLGTLPNEHTTHYCGSGVSACHNVLAQVHAGLPEPRLYCGSWSEWCRDPDRPIATGRQE